MSAEGATPRLLRRGLAIAVAVPLVLLVVIEGPRLWDAFAYRGPERQLGFEIRPKRWSWLPGAAVRIPEQPCPSCQRGDHERCAHRVGLVILQAPWRSTAAGGGFPAGTLISTAGTITVRSHVGSDEISGEEMESASFVFDGVSCSPETFRCPCCGFD